MEGTKKGNNYMMQRLQNPFRGSGQLLLSSSNLDVVSTLNKSKIRSHLPHNNTGNLQNFGFDNNSSNMVEIPPSNQPISPYSQIPVAREGVQNLALGSSHSRSFSQSSFFVDDSLPPLNPSLYQRSTSPPNTTDVGELHRRCYSEVPFKFDTSSITQSSTINALPTLNQSLNENSTSPPNGGEKMNSSNGGLMESYDGNASSMLPPIPFGMGNSFDTTDVRELHRRCYSEVPYKFDTSSMTQSSTIDALPTLNPSLNENTSPPNGVDNVNSSHGGLMESYDGNANSMLPPIPFGIGNAYDTTEAGELHRQFYSEVPFKFDSIMQSTVPPIDDLPTLNPSLYENPTSPPNGVENVNSLTGGSMESHDGNANSMLPPTPDGMENSFYTSEVEEFLRQSSSASPFGFGSTSPPIHSHKRELSSQKNINSKEEDELADYLVSNYLNLDSIDAINSCGTNDKTSNGNFDDMGNRASGSKTNGCDNSNNEAGISVNEGPIMVAASGERKMSAATEAAVTTRQCRHYRSKSVDSYMGKRRSGDGSSKLSPSLRASKIVNGFKIAFGDGEFTTAEMKKITANPKLAKVALIDPKRAKRMVANQMSALRSKERETRYIEEQENKLKTLQAHKAKLSVEFTSARKKNAKLKSTDKDLQLIEQALKQPSNVRVGVQRMKITRDEITEFMSKLSEQQQLSQNNLIQEKQTARDLNCGAPGQSANYSSPQFIHFQQQQLSQNNSIQEKQTAQDFNYGAPGHSANYSSPQSFQLQQQQLSQNSLTQEKQIARDLNNGAPGQSANYSSPQSFQIQQQQLSQNSLTQEKQMARDLNNGAPGQRANYSSSQFFQVQKQLTPNNFTQENQMAQYLNYGTPRQSTSYSSAQSFQDQQQQLSQNSLTQQKQMARDLNNGAPGQSANYSSSQFFQVQPQQLTPNTFTQENQMAQYLNYGAPGQSTSYSSPQFFQFQQQQLNQNNSTQEKQAAPDLYYGAPGQSANYSNQSNNGF